MKVIPFTELAVFDDDWNWSRFRQRNTLDDSLRRDIYESYAVYVLWNRNPGNFAIPAVYIGSTGSGKSIRNRLGTHKRKLVGDPDYSPGNWRKYREEEDYEISDFHLGYYVCGDEDEAIHAEASLLAHHFNKFRIAPRCNAHYKANHTFKKTVRKILTAR